MKYRTFLKKYGKLLSKKVLKELKEDKVVQSKKPPKKEDIPA